MSIKILIADDEELSARLLADYLEEDGLPRATIITQPEKALSFIEEQKPDLVFLDVSFEMEMSGIDILRQIKKTVPETAVCMMTGFREDCLAEVMALGVNAFIGKPAPMEDYARVAHEFVEWHNSTKKGI